MASVRVLPAWRSVRLDVYFRDGLRIQKCRVCAGGVEKVGGARPGMGKRRDLEEPVRAKVAARVVARQWDTVGGGRVGGGRFRVQDCGRVLVWHDTCHLRRVTALVL